MVILGVLYQRLPKNEFPLIAFLFRATFIGIIPTYHWYSPLMNVCVYFISAKKHSLRYILVIQMDTCIKRIVISRILMLCGCFYRRKEAYHKRQQALKTVRWICSTRKTWCCKHIFWFRNVKEVGIFQPNLPKTLLIFIRHFMCYLKFSK